MKWLLRTVVLCCAAACSTSNGTPDGSTANDGGDSAVADVVPADVPSPQRPEDCDPLDESACSFPWPSNLYLRPDPSRPTGHRLSFGTGLPLNRQLVVIDPAFYAHLDGYGPGTPIMTVFPGLDPALLAGEDHIERSMAPDATILLFEVRGAALVRVPYWAELDLNDAAVDQRTLMVHPAVILREATRYVVAMRALRTRAGAPIAPSAAFMRLRDGTTADDARLAPRQARFNEVFGLLETAGVPRASLTLAWDFVTASSRAMHGRLLAMIDDALTAVGPTGPALTVRRVQEYTRTADGSGRPTNAHIAVEIEGTFDVPNYLRSFTRDNYQGRSIVLDAAGRPMPQGMRSPRFWMRIPHSAIGGRAQILLHYGHGLFGLGSEIRAEYMGEWCDREGMIVFSASMTGMSEDDLGYAIPALANGNLFVGVTDGLQQGLMEWVLLARAARERFADLPELRSRNVTIDRTRMHYSGNSQGGIFGASYMAVTPDIRYGHLGVGGCNYSILMQRSVDFGTFYGFLRQGYRRPVDHLAFMAAGQLLWDSSDCVSFVRHISAEPFAGRSRHDVIVGVARGDHQVAVLTDEVVARSDVGWAVMRPYDRMRTLFGVTEQDYPHRGSGLILFDFGNPWPPPGNVPPTAGRDPHEGPRRALWHQRQISRFFETGEITDACGGDGCTPM